MRDLFRRLRYLLNYRRFDQELADDMEFHREMAAREGKGNFGNALHLREEARDAWGWLWIERLAQDLCYAARVLRKSPGFTLAAVLMLAIGIGVNVAVFGFFDLMVLRPLNVRDPGTLLQIPPARTLPLCVRAALSGNGFLPREHSNALGRAGREFHQSRGGRRGEATQRELRDGELLPRTGQRAAVLGRLLDPARDEASGAEPVVVLGHGYWQRHFGADPLIVGKTIRLNGKAATVVGVAASDFSGLSLNEPALWAPISQQPYFANGSRLLTDFSVESPGVQMWGRLQPGQNPKAAEEELRSLAAELRRQHPTAIWEDERLPSEPGAYAVSSLIGNRRGTGTEQRDPVFPVFALVGTLTLADSRRGVRQFGQHAAGARRGAAARNCDSRRDRSRQRPIDPAIVHRESGAGACWDRWRAWRLVYIVLRGLLVVAKGSGMARCGAGLARGGFRPRRWDSPLRSCSG